ncbi:SGNH/GDSL hydrolase family protein [Paenibacillus crassostreae]|uniref:GDSL family lipase n=1 Tax=Paenibacillus crassostreae TaxID=1763538 RepID=A0A167FUH6_9BACL|nr:SGNH/GDSL hydrolase family protein [Paenibacillus crassostreae]AOZ94053.1 GDSL family lipase [Paenibacillus crassostreae]OAB76912.1 GDSL family lipase [Paenibacillus crassostreae]
MLSIGNNETVLFIGDSVTDCGRDYSNDSSLGSGYAFLVAAELGRKYPKKNLNFINRGINGNRVVDLETRWEEDCIQLNPAWISIYIGINDVWRHYDNNDETSVEKFYKGYRQLIERTNEHTDAKIILVEPFCLPVPEDRKSWREDLDPKIQAIRELASEFKSLYVPLDGLFASASTQVDPAYWAGDGVHPTVAGHALIAKAWLETVQA